MKVILSISTTEGKVMKRDREKFVRAAKRIHEEEDVVEIDDDADIFDSEMRRLRRLIMNKKTLKALRGSIKKWEGIVKGEVQDEGAKNCPLCVEFYRPDCAGCPVQEETGQEDCADTPYSKWCDTDYRVKNANSKELAQQMLNFLVDLLPEKTNA